MQKRGQITVFLILGLVLIIIFGLMYYSSNYKKAKTIKAQAAKGNAQVADVVAAYAENCIKKAAEDALFSRIGPQGGFINPNGDAKYKEEGVKNSLINPPTTSFDTYTIPYYLKAEQICIQDSCQWDYTENVPEINSIKERLGNYVMAEFEKCFNTTVFENIGMKVVKPSAAKVSVDVGLNQEDVSVKLTYPLTIIAIKDKSEANIDSFVVVLPIRIKALYDGAKEFINQIKTAGLSYDTFPLKYSISQQHCSAYYDKNHLTNVYFKNNEVVQFVDFSTYEEKYLNSFIFQFAVKNVNVEGVCAG